MMRTHQMSDAQRDMLAEMWETVRKFQDDVAPMEALAMLAQCMGAVVAGGHIPMDDRDQLIQLISLNLDVGFHGMQSAMKEQEEAGHA